MYKRLIFTLTPKTAFATPLVGDTLFGQCCWVIRHILSAEKLTEILTGYTDHKPFMVERRTRRRRPASTQRRPRAGRGGRSRCGAGPHVHVDDRAE